MKRFLPLALAGALLLGAAAPVAAAPNQRAIQTALVGVLIQAGLEDVLNNATVEVITVDINSTTCFGTPTSTSTSSTIH